MSESVLDTPARTYRVMKVCDVRKGDRIYDGLDGAEVTGNYPCHGNHITFTDRIGQNFSPGASLLVYRKP